MFKIIKLLFVSVFCLQFAIMAWKDHKEKTVSLGELMKLFFLSLAFFFLQLFLVSSDERFWFLLDTAEGILIGLAFLGVSFISAERIGFGDSILVLILGIFTGGWRLTSILEIACILLLGRALWIWKKNGKIKMIKNDRIPFYPFLFVGYLLTVLLKMG